MPLRDFLSLSGLFLVFLSLYFYPSQGAETEREDDPESVSVSCSVIDRNSASFCISLYLFLFQGAETVSEDDPSNLDFRFYRLFESEPDSPRHRSADPVPQVKEQPGTTRPDKYGRVFLVPCEKGDLSSVRYCIYEYTGHVIFYKVPETHGHI